MKIHRNTLRLLHYGSGICAMGFGMIAGSQFPTSFAFWFGASLAFAGLLALVVMDLRIFLGLDRAEEDEK